MEIRKRIQELPHYREVNYDELGARYGAEFVDHRLEKQWKLYHWRYHSRMRWAARAYAALFRLAIRVGLTCLGQWKKAQALARSPEVVERDVFLPGLPESFEGYRILHLTDFHFDYHEALAGIARSALSELSFDLCVLTGDYRGGTLGPFVDSMADLKAVRDVLGQEVYAVLGNHDCIEMAPHMQEMGVKLLVNEYVWLERGEDRILLAGIDDPHFYQLHDFSSMRRPLQDSSASLLLSHSPEAYLQAAEEGFDFQLSGHTHGGQICLPGGKALLTRLKVWEPGMEKGAWHWKGLQGYTSRGIGASSVTARVNCPPEITVHVLRSGRPSGTGIGS